MDYASILDEAIEAARDAIRKHVKAHPDNPFAFDCGFAWVIVKPARGPFITWLKKQIELCGFKVDSVGNLIPIAGVKNLERRLAYKYGRRACDGGWKFWQPGSDVYSGQSIYAFEAGAKAFAKVLNNYGINAYVDSRLD